eukprot:1146614-Pelagomonas_calceolata.AAC.2
MQAIGAKGVCHGSPWVSHHIKACSPGDISGTATKSASPAPLLCSGVQEDARCINNILPPNASPMHCNPMHTPKSGMSGPNSLTACKQIPESEGFPENKCVGCRGNVEAREQR